MVDQEFLWATTSGEVARDHGRPFNLNRKEINTMSPRASAMLVNDVVPRLRAAAPSVPKIGSDDNEEVFADMTANAAKMIDSADRAGKKFTPGNIAYFVGRAARSGRRSTGSSRTDVFSPGCLLDGLARHEDLDGPVEGEGFGELHDVIAGPAIDPAEDAARNMDWQAFLAGHPPRHRVAILVLARGGTMREAGRLCGIGDSAALQLKRRIARDLIEFFGEDVIRRLLAGVKPQWEAELRAGRERHLCHAERGGKGGFE